MANVGYRPARGFLWENHMVQVMKSAKKLMETYSFGRRLHAVMALPVDYGTFKEMVYAGAWLHDLGKLGPEFQTMLWEYEKGLLSQRSVQRTHLGLAALPIPEEAQERFKRWKRRATRHRQLYRHEFLSVVLGAHHGLPVRAWLKDRFGKDWIIPLAAGGGHHRKLDSECFTVGRELMEGNKDPHVLWYFNDVLPPLNRFCRRSLQFSPPDLFCDVPKGEPCAQMTPERMLEVYDALCEEAVDDETPLMSAVKWCVVLADVYASIGSKDADRSHEDFAREMWSSFERADKPGMIDFHARINKKVGTSTLRTFQRRCQRSGDLTIVTPTGSGKTVAALAWASTKPDKPLLMAFPATELASQARLEYGLMGDELRHHRAWMEDWMVEAVLPTTEEELLGDTPDIVRNMQADVTFTTIDQVVGPLSFRAQSVLWLPHIVRSQVVFDEFHSYRSDKRLRSFHQRFLEWFPGIPCAHMSATVFEDDQKRLSEIGRSGFTILPSKDDAWDRSPRYRFHCLKPHEVDDVTLPPGSLRVANVVRRVQALGEVHDEAHVIHSRFKYGVRRVKRKAMIEMVGQRKGLVIGSPIVELGFDMNAAAMLTEMCPPSSLIQRVGRVNRGEPDGVKDVYVYMPEDGMPYNREKYWKASKTTWHGWWAWLKAHEGQDVSTYDLRESMVQDTVPLEMPSSRGLFTRVSAMRHLPFHETVLLRKDVYARPNKREAAMKGISALLWGRTRQQLRLAGAVYGYYYVVDWPYSDKLGLRSE